MTAIRIQTEVIWQLLAVTVRRVGSIMSSATLLVLLCRFLVLRSGAMTTEATDIIDVFLAGCASLEVTMIERNTLLPSCVNCYSLCTGQIVSLTLTVAVASCLNPVAFFHVVCDILYHVLAAGCSAG